MRVSTESPNSRPWVLSRSRYEGVPPQRRGPALSEPAGARGLGTTRRHRFLQASDGGARVIPTEQVGGRANLPALDTRGAAVLKHETVPMVSYPYEWPFGMLRDAALLQLDVTRAALDEGMTLKDATPFNIQWVGPRPTFIDIGSFTANHPGDPWAGYRQFCELFLYPPLTAGLPKRAVPCLAARESRRHRGRTVPVAALGAGLLPARRADACLPAGQGAGPIRKLRAQYQVGSPRRRFRSPAHYAQRGQLTPARRTVALDAPAVDLVRLSAHPQVRAG